jgi:hypothetical protein
LLSKNNFGFYTGFMVHVSKVHLIYIAIGFIFKKLETEISVHLALARRYFIKKMKYGWVCEQATSYCSSTDRKIYVEPLKVLEKQRITLLKFMIFLKQVHF